MAAIARLGALRQSMWYDEFLTLASARVPFHQVIQSVINHENLPPLYFILINRWACLFGTSDISLRIPSMLFGVASVWLLFHLVHALTGNIRAALFAATILAFSRYHIAYSQEARPYSMQFFLCCASCLLFVRLLSRPACKSDQVLYTLSSAAAIWTQPFSALVLLAQDLFLLTNRKSIRTVLTLQAIIALSYWPWLNHSWEAYQIGQPWMPDPSVWLTFVHYCGSKPLLIFFTICTAIGICFAWKKREPNILLPILLLFMPIALPVACSTHKHILFTDRYGIAALIGLSWLAAIGITSITVRGLPYLLLIAFFALALPELLRDFHHGVTAQARADVKSATAFVDRLAHENDAVVCTGLSESYGFDAYNLRPDLIKVQSFPPPLEPTTLWIITADDPKIIRQQLIPSHYQLLKITDFTGSHVYQLQHN